MTKPRPLIAVSSLTGNTRIIAHGLADAIEGALLVNADQAPEDLSGFDPVVLCFWCDRGMAPQETQALAQRLTGKRVACFATMGGNPADERARQWLHTTSVALAQAGSDNTLAVEFACRGRIDPALFERMTAMAGGKVSPERRARQLESQTHPDRLDVLNAVQAYRDAFETHKE